VSLLVLGAGLAGAVAALRAADLGVKVTLLYKGSDAESAASAWAQGGIVYKAEQGDPELLKKDLALSSGGQQNLAAVDLVLKEGPALIEEFFQKRFSVNFDLDEKGKWALGLEAAHSARRILHISDQTGAALLKPLKAAVEAHPNITIIKGDLVELLVTYKHAQDQTYRFSKPRCFGAYILSADKGVFPVEAQATILATGGYSGLYLHSTGPRTNFGAGIASAWRAGARIMDMEFIQFHPTTLFIEGQPRSLLTEALRGEGAKLLNFAGKRFVDEMAPRDIVSRAIHSEMAASQRPCVFLDLRSIKNLKEKFHHVAALLDQNNLNPSQDLIPVVPAAHYTMGGVWTDLNGQSSIEGLWAAGEVACTGLHGANRLASMSLLEALVFGDAAAKSVCESLSQKEKWELPTARSWIPATEKVDAVLVQQDWSLLRQTLWNYVGIVRSQSRLERAKRIVSELRVEVEDFYKSADLSPELLALRLGVIVGYLTLESALRRKESLASHYVETAT
jgi:L-aspartate oxidase